MVRDGYNETNQLVASSTALINLSEGDEDEDEECEYN